MFARANQARTNTLDAQNRENETLQGYEDAIDYVLGAEVTGVDTSVTNPVEAMPTGATVIQGNASEGIVIRDENGNEWVWVEVPKTTDVYSSTTLSSIIDVDNITDDQCTTIYEDLANYASAYRKEGFADTFYSTEQHGFKDADAYNTAKNNMLRSVYKYGGFWIGRYETGSTSERNDTTEILTEPIVKQNVYPYNFVTCSQAQKLSEELAPTGKDGSLLLGIQWDLVCKYIETKGTKLANTIEERKDKILNNSSDWGNYSNVEFVVNKGFYSIFDSITGKLGNWNNITNNYLKSNIDGQNMILLSTGATDRNKILNIYDFAGNLYEWTLEYSGSVTSSCSRRGGYYGGSGDKFSAINHRGSGTTGKGTYIGFRTTFF